MHFCPLLLVNMRSEFVKMQLAVLLFHLVSIKLQQKMLLPCFNVQMKMCTVAAHFCICFRISFYSVFFFKNLVLVLPNWWSCFIILSGFRVFACVYMWKPRYWCLFLLVSIRAGSLLVISATSWNNDCPPGYHSLACFYTTTRIVTVSKLSFQ